MHAAGDERARRHGWEVIESTGRFGFGARTYRHPRFDDRRRQHSPPGSLRGQPQVRPRDTPRKTILRQREAEPAMNDRDAARTVSAVSFQLLYTADEAALMLRVKPRWLKRQAAARRSRLRCSLDRTGSRLATWKRSRGCTKSPQNPQNLSK